MGEPVPSHIGTRRGENVTGSNPEELTWRTETSKYPVEEKSTEIPKVAASEMGRV